MILLTAVAVQHKLGIRFRICLEKIGSGNRWLTLELLGLARIFKKDAFLPELCSLHNYHFIHPRKKRKRGVKREVELLHVGGPKDEAMGRVGDVNGGVRRRGEGCVGVRWRVRGEDEWDSLSWAH